MDPRLWHLRCRLQVWLVSLLLHNKVRRQQVLSRLVDLGLVQQMKGPVDEELVVIAKKMECTEVQTTARRVLHRLINQLAGAPPSRLPWWMLLKNLLQT